MGSRKGYFLKYFYFFVIRIITLRLFLNRSQLAHSEKMCMIRGYGGAGHPVDVRLARTEAERRPESTSRLPGKKKSQSEF